MSSERSLANLRPWKPGQSGNPAGRPKRKTIVEAMEDELRRLAREGGIDQDEAATIVARKWIAMILQDGDVSALKEYLARRDGVVRQEVDVVHNVADIIRAENEQWLRPRDVVPELPEAPDDDAG